MLFTKLAIQQLFWQAIIRHAGHVPCTPDLSLLEKSVHSLNAGLCEDFCVMYPLLPPDLQELCGQVMWKWLGCLACLL